MKTEELEKLINDLRTESPKNLNEVENFLIQRFLSVDSAIFLNECTSVGE